MTDTRESRVPLAGAVMTIQQELSSWLLERALPLWDTHGVDRQSGGFFESLAATADPAGFTVTGAVRRGRVVSRQIYCFDLGRRLGWQSAASNPVEHGCDYLFSYLHRGDGEWHTAIDAATRQPSAAFSLYEQAFYLFALARLQPIVSDRYPIAATALRCLERLRRSVGKDIGGFEESLPASLPLKSNPHMHLLEAALAWMEIADPGARDPWAELGRELVDLCLSRFCDESTGMIREYFDADWSAAAGDDGRILEPGHQFEWAWLLMQWARCAGGSPADRAACLTAADRLLDSGERWGVDERRGVAVNELWDDMTVKDAAAKLWPQTERLKAWCARLGRAGSAVETDWVCGRIVAAAHGLMRYLRADTPGLWHEVCAPDGAWDQGPSKASSLYHIACAIDVLGFATREHLL